MLPAVMRWNKPANTERQALVAAAMGHPREDAGDVLDAFIAGLGMPRSLGAVKSARRISTAWPSRRWALRGCRATRGRSPALLRSAKSSN
jgi:alcohol dehydrogenase class IV